MNTVKYTYLASIDADSVKPYMRVSRITFRADSNAAQKRESLGAVIPALTASNVTNLLNSCPEFTAYMVRHLCSIQDSLVREKLTDLPEGGTIALPGDSELASYIREAVNKARAEAFRLSAKSITDWVTSSGLADNLATALASHPSLQCATNDPRVSKLVAAYTANICLLAGKSPIPENIATQVVKALDKVQVGPEDIMKEKLLKRVEELTAVISLDDFL